MAREAAASRRPVKSLNGIRAGGGQSIVVVPRACRRARPGSLSRPRAIAVATGLAVVLNLLNSCAGPGEDVRVTLCKDLVVALMDGRHAVQWVDSNSEARGREGLFVRLRFAVDDGADQAVVRRATCLYRYNAVDDTALTLSDPMSAYSTSPYEMRLGERRIRNPELADAIKQAMIGQGRQLIERAREGIERAAESVSGYAADR